MCVAINKEQVVAGYINRHEDGKEFTISDVMNYIRSLWNIGCGPIRLNFTQQDLKDFLDTCAEICLNKTLEGYIIDKSLLSNALSQEELEYFNRIGKDDSIAKSFDLFCKLHVDLRTPVQLLDAMGFSFLR